jgi:hypothetical protein
MPSAHISISWGTAWRNIRDTRPYEREKDLLQNQNVMQEVINYQLDWENNVINFVHDKNQ